MIKKRKTRSKSKRARRPKKKSWLESQTRANQSFLNSIGLGFLAAPARKLGRATKRLTNKTISKVRSLKYV